MLHPKVAAMSCDYCAKWFLDEKLERVYRNDGKGGKIYQERPKGHATPCHQCPKTEGLPIEKRTRKNAVTLTFKNQMALQHYLECRAVNQFPDDPIVRRNASIITPFYEMIEQKDMMRVLSTLTSVMVKNA